MRGIYAIVDADFLATRAIPLVSFAERVVAARPAALQLRAKRAGARETLDWLRAVVPLCRAAGVLSFANDRPDLAVLAGCDGVHVGQTDLSVEEVRRFSPSLLVGVSTHDEGQVREALASRPDYLAFGPVFPTTSKENPSPTVGLTGLAHAAAACRAEGIPLVGIGGIDVARVASVAEYADAAAVISALLPAEGLAGVTARVSELARCFESLGLRRTT